MKLLFLSLEPDWVDLAEKSGYNTYLGKVQDYVPDKETKNVYYISCANSLGFMDGGIDKVYSQIMFPGIEPKIKEKIKKLGYKSKLGRPFIPIGKAIVTKTDILHPNGQSYLITSPTMLMPQNVSNTPNAFLAMVGVIKLMKEYKHFINEDDLLIIPSMCCGWGKMKIETSIKQIKEALEHKEIEKLKLDFNKILNIQPKLYENTEWVDIPFDKIIK